MQTHVALVRFSQKDEARIMPAPDPRRRARREARSMTSELALPLLVLALLDGLSIGTLLIPLFLMIAPGRVRAGRIMLYLATITVFYFAVGVLFSLGIVNLVDAASDFLQSHGGLVLRLIFGAVLLIVAIAMPTTKKRVNDEPEQTPRLIRWRNALVAHGTRPIAVMSVALGAGLIEVATMVPYIVAMTMMAEARLTPLEHGSALAIYCVVMILPAVLFLVLRIVAARMIDAPLQKLAAWLQRTGTETTAWVLGLIGLVVAREAAVKLQLFDGNVFENLRSLFLP